jgi:hypothetical protein
VSSSDNPITAGAVVSGNPAGLPLQAQADPAAIAQSNAQAAAISGQAAAVAATEAARQAQNSADSAKGNADASKGNADAAKGHADRAQVAAVLANSGSEPSWAYGMVIGFLGAALLALIAVVAITALKGKTINTDVMSATTLILGGLIGVLAPSPGGKK